MDPYTARTRAWLDAIYEGPPGIPYVPHSPVHGFEPRARYIGTYCHLFAILSELSRYEFDSCLEVGSGEGFLAEAIRRLFGVPVLGVDLSHRVCRRARDFFALPAAVGEATALPFADAAVELVVSLNTLEHVPDIAAAWRELRRVGRGVVVAGLPHARRAGERESAEEPHAHVSLLTHAEMRQLFGPEARLRGSLSRLVRPLYAVAASDDVSQREGYRGLNRPGLRALYGAVRRLGDAVGRRRAVAGLCRLEDFASRRWPRATYESIVVAAGPRARPRRAPLPADRILEALLR